jgi:hypothetical protein
VAEPPPGITSQTINALWSINQDKNAWLGVVGAGWVRLPNASNSGIVALSMLVAHAYRGKRLMNYRQEADGLIHEICVW